MIYRGAEGADIETLLRRRWRTRTRTWGKDSERVAKEESHVRLIRFESLARLIRWRAICGGAYARHFLRAARRKLAGGSTTFRAAGEEPSLGATEGAFRKEKGREL